MTYGIVNTAVAPIYEGPYRTKAAGEPPGRMVSAIADEGLYGTAVAVTGSWQQGYLPVRTFYGYEGYMDPADLILTEESQLGAWEASNLMAINGIVTDILSLPRVQGERLLSLYRGSLVSVEALESEENGWARVCLPDGRTGYMRNQFLMSKQFSQVGVFDHTLPQVVVLSETAFRQAVVDTARTYLGTQYRWGGRSSAGIDCSGLTSVSYMLNGILIYRDAKIMEGYPVHEICRDRMKKGDLLYFPGHIAMYLGDDKYIHATGRVGSGGVVINSLNSGDEDYRDDLVKGMCAVGSVF